MHFLNLITKSKLNAKSAINKIKMEQKNKSLKKRYLIPILIIGAVIVIFFIWTFNSRKNISTGYSVNNLAAEGDLFKGVITNMQNISNVELGKKFYGIGVYDRNCVQVGTSPATGNPIVNCHAGINTTEYGLLDFNHEHDYYKNPCIIEEEKVVITILDSQGNAEVQRVSKESKKAIQEGWAMQK